MEFTAKLIVTFWGPLRTKFVSSAWGLSALLGFQKAIGISCEASSSHFQASAATFIIYHSSLPNCKLFIQNTFYQIVLQSFFEGRLKYKPFCPSKGRIQIYHRMSNASTPVSRFVVRDLFSDLFSFGKPQQLNSVSGFWHTGRFHWAKRDGRTSGRWFYSAIQWPYEPLH